jgi:hypothetical protein
MKENPKTQTPNPKETPSPKHQTRVIEACDGIGVWNLGLLWVLGFGFWDFCTHV